MSQCYLKMAVHFVLHIILSYMPLIYNTAVNSNLVSSCHSYQKTSKIL